MSALEVQSVPGVELEYCRKYPKILTKNDGGDLIDPLVVMETFLH